MAKMTKLQKRMSVFRYLINFETIKSSNVDRLIEIVNGFKVKSFFAEARDGKVFVYMTTYCGGFPSHDLWEAKIVEASE